MVERYAAKRRAPHHSRCRYIAMLAWQPPSSTRSGAYTACKRRGRRPALAPRQSRRDSFGCDLGCSDAEISDLRSCTASKTKSISGLIDSWPISNNRLQTSSRPARSLKRGVRFDIHGAQHDEPCRVRRMRRGVPLKRPRPPPGAVLNRSARSEPSHSCTHDLGTYPVDARVCDEANNRSEATPYPPPW